MIDPFSINAQGSKEAYCSCNRTYRVGATLASQPVRPNLENLEISRTDVHYFLLQQC